MARRGWLWVAWMVACGTADPQDDAPTAEDPILGSCAYVNTFSGGPECKEYVGAAWSLEDAQADCASPFIGADPGVFTADARCVYPSILGRCLLDEGTDLQVDLVFPGDDPGACGGVQVGCGFGQGTFVPSPVCEEDDAPPVTSGGVFRPFEQVCVEPAAGEDPGQGPDGDVCTWEAISACTEEGRKYADYATCDAVLSQRPYAAYTASETSPDPSRLSDPTFVEELEWVTAQVESCACVCCHSNVLAPNGPSGWYTEAPGIWTDLLDDDAMAMMAGWVDSTAFGAFPPEENNGFSRDQTGAPTTDPARMKAFFEGELRRRGFEREDFADTAPFGGVLYDQLFYEPGPCPDGTGVDGDGVVTWSGGGARYVYVLEEGSNSPGVPPNLDLPDGTLWRLDVAPDDAPLADGFTFGEVPEGATQTYPKDGAPAPLVDGETYYLVVLRDVYQPLQRCLFTPGG